jgi:hypothetical protein
LATYLLYLASAVLQIHGLGDFFDVDDLVIDPHLEVLRSLEGVGVLERLDDGRGLGHRVPVLGPQSPHMIAFLEQLIEAIFKFASFFF